MAKIAEATAKQHGLEANIIAIVRLTALIQDLGRISVANSIWDKPGSLTDNEWKQIYSRAYYTKRIISKSEVLRPDRTWLSCCVIVYLCCEINCVTYWQITFALSEL